MSVSPSTIEFPGASVVQTLDIHPDGDIVVVGHDTLEDGARPLTLFSLETLEPIRELEVGGDATRPHLMTARFSSDGRSIAYIDTRRSPRLLDVESGTHRAIDVDDDEVTWLSFARSAPLLAIAGARTRLWNPEAGEVVWELAEKTTQASAVAAVSPDGKLVGVSGSSGAAVVLYDIQNGREVGRLKGGPEESRWIGFDGAQRYMLALEAYSHGVFLWDVDSGERHLVDEFDADATGYTTAAFRPGTTELALGMRTGIVRLLDVADGTDLIDERAHGERVWDVAFSPDGSALVTGGADGRALVWNLD